MSFNFQDYLTRLDPEHQYLITELTGGIVNITVRATCSDGHGAMGNGSMILKYAPPYIAQLGSSAPMTQWRQTVEARALEMVHEIVYDDRQVQIPRVLKHDLTENVLVLTDLGRLPNLQELFSELGGYTDFTGPPKILPKPLTAAAPELRFYSAVGEKLGRFLARLHSPDTLDRMKLSQDFGLDYLRNPEQIETSGSTIQGTLDRLAQFPDLLHQNHKRLFGILQEDHHRPLAYNEKSLVLGDCWPAAVLVSPKPQISNPCVCVIDWEFAEIGRGLHGDMAQFLAYLELFHIAAGHQQSTAYCNTIDVLANDLVGSYAAECQKQQAPWTQPQHENLYYSVLRSALLSQAVEMVNCAFWKVWPCKDLMCTCDHGTEHTKSLQNCALIKKMMARAIRYIELARKTPEEFAELENWECLVQAKIQSKGWGLLGLVSTSRLA